MQPSKWCTILSFVRLCWSCDSARHHASVEGLLLSLTCAAFFLTTSALSLLFIISQLINPQSQQAAIVNSQLLRRAAACPAQHVSTTNGSTAPDTEICESLSTLRGILGHVH